MRKKDEAELKITFYELAKRVYIIEKGLEKLTSDLDKLLKYDSRKYRDRKRPGLV